MRVDVNLRAEEVEERRDLVISEYDDVRPFVVTVLTRHHLLAEKVRALLVRVDMAPATSKASARLCWRPPAPWRRNPARRAAARAAVSVRLRVAGEPDLSTAKGR